MRLRIEPTLLLVALVMLGGSIYFLVKQSGTANTLSVINQPKIFVHPNVPDGILKTISAAWGDLNRYNVAESESDADYTLNYDSGSSCKLLYKQFFAPVVPFSSLTDNLTLDELKRSFTTAKPSAQFRRALVLTKDAPLLVSSLGGELQTAKFNSLAELTSALKSGDIALLPFNSISPEVKVLTIDGSNILNKKLNLATSDFPHADVSICPANQTKIPSSLTISTPLNNRNLSKMTTTILTGVTAISRGVEAAIRGAGDPSYPALAVKDVLSAADITHVSSENPLFDDCKPEMEGVVLCGKTASIAALKAIGTDIVDLSGNHQADYGSDKFHETIVHLKNAKFKLFGGGINETEASKILYLTKNKTTFAYLSYAYFDSLNGREYRSLAYQNRSGANYYSAEKMKADIEKAKSRSDFVQVDFQFTESYSYSPLPEQVQVFQQAIDDGADMVVGVQSHQPQSVEFYKGKLIFYGLGNFFFDQMWSLGTRQGIIPRLTFYNKKLISVELLTTLLYNYSQPQFVTGSDRQAILSEILP